MKLSSRILEISEKNPLVMAICNVTPDSFSDGNSPVPLEKRLETMLQEDADIIDIGGESTRPGAAEVPVKEEISRVLPALKLLKKMAPELPVSIDTRKSAVAEACLIEGAEILNDVSGFLFDPAMGKIAAKYRAGCIVMHARSTPSEMQQEKNFIYPEGVVQGVKNELGSRVKKLLETGVSPESIILDPGFGFAKTAEQSFELIRGGRELLKLGFPLLSGPSRKSFIGKATGITDPAERDFGTCGAVIASLLAGYTVFRVHNTAAMKACLKVFLNGYINTAHGSARSVM